MWLVDRLHGMDGGDYTVHQYFEQGFRLRDNFSVDCGLKCGFKKLFEYLIFFIQVLFECQNIQNVKPG